MPRRTTKHRFPYRTFVEFSPEDDAYVARVPALGAMGHGDTAEEAVREAGIGAKGILDAMKAERRPIPPPDMGADYSGRVLLRLPRSVHEQVALRAAAEGVSVNQELVSLVSFALGAGSTSAA